MHKVVADNAACILIYYHLFCNMKILVTGAAGFIGYHTINRLMTDGHEVVGIDNLCQPSTHAIKLARLSRLGIDTDAISAGKAIQISSGKFEFILMDILDRKSVQALCTKADFDCIVHLAAHAGTKPSMAHPTEFFDVNTIGTQNMLEAARLCNTRHFFFSSSYVVHGARAQAPLKENDDVDTPMSMYAASKRSAELLCYTYAHAYKLPITIFRFFTAYGQWGRPDSKPMRIAHSIATGEPITLLNDGYLVRDFTYIDDIIDGMMMALSTPPSSTARAPYALYNIGRSKPIPMLSFIQAIEVAMGKTANIERDPASPITKGESVEMYADTGKLENELAYSPVWDYEEAAPIFAQWFLENYNVTFNM